MQLAVVIGGRKDRKLRWCWRVREKGREWSEEEEKVRVVERGVEREGALGFVWEERETERRKLE